MIYLVHFEQPLAHARHYLGFVDTEKDRDPVKALESRLDYHRRGRGSKLLAAVARAGIPFDVVRTWPEGTRTQERKLKGHSSTRICPVCEGDLAWGRGRLDVERQVQAEIDSIVSGGAILS